MATPSSSSSSLKPLKTGFYRVDLFKAVWEVPVHYIDIATIGTGAYGTVWYASYIAYIYIRVDGRASDEGSVN